MTSTPPPDLFRKFAGLLTFFVGALFFTGWIYRWAYFSFFSLELTTLDLPPQSFLFVPLQVFFKSFRDLESLLQSLISLLLLLGTLYIAIPLTVEFVRLASDRLANILNRFIKAIWRKSTPRFQAINFNRSLWDEAIALVWLIVLLFLLARHQGLQDARLDAGPDSNLPAVTLIVPENQLGLGFKPGDDYVYGAGFQVLGDRQRYENLQQFITNSRHETWRLLLDQGGFFYLTRTLTQADKRPLVLIVPADVSGQQLLILSPEPLP